MIVLVLLAHVLATHVLPAKKLLTREILFCVLAWVLMGLWNPSAALILAIAHALIEVARWVANAFRATADGSSGAARYGLCVFVIATDRSSRVSRVCRGGLCFVEDATTASPVANSYISMPGSRYRGTWNSYVSLPPLYGCRR